MIALYLDNAARELYDTDFLLLGKSSLVNISSLKQQGEMDAWYVYLIRTQRGSLYCGVTLDVKRRFAEHQAGGQRCARALRGKGPLELAFYQKVGDQSYALRMEYKVKQLSKAQKEALVTGQKQLEELCS